jgi:ATP-dependent Lon protease
MKKENTNIINNINNINIKENNLNTESDINILIDKKIVFFQDVIQKTILYVQHNKILDILGVSEVNSCIQSLYELSKKILNIIELKNINNNHTDEIINHLQNINNELSSLFKSFGTYQLEDLLYVCFGNNNIISLNELEKSKFELLKKFFHPVSYKILLKKNELDNKNKNNTNTNTNDCKLSESSSNFDLCNVSITLKSFHLKVHGVQLIIHNEVLKKSLIITGIIDDIIINILNNKYINHKISLIKENTPKEIEFTTEYFKKFIEALTLKDLLINKYNEIYSKFIGYISNLNTIKMKSINQTVKEYMSGDLYAKRLMILQLLLYYNKNDNQYLAYLLYDLLSNDINGNIDTQEQIILFDSFPWLIKQYFRDAMKKTIQYTNDLSNYDIQKIPLEQQICLLKSSDIVKEKAMQKLKEVKSKSEDSGSKARQYLDGLLKIPFNIYRKEPILNSMDNIKIKFNNLLHNYKIKNIPLKDNYTSLEISHYLKNIKNNNENYSNNNIEILKKQIITNDKTLLIKYITIINNLYKNNNITIPFILTKKRISDCKEYINNCLDLINTNYIIQDELLCIINNTTSFTQNIDDIQIYYNNIQDYMEEMKIILDNAVHGHEKAKKQIFRIIGQWINGQQDGYCFGFEGPPGVGKTSLAKKGLSNCLKDENEQSRPFAMIQIGGDSNGSSLHGHNYTYVGSTWGSIIQIIMDKKCMNPIIFIDEIDKISKTENGKEIIGILTHLLDPSQNDCFQDKYFTGIDLDLSKALFILSYNDVDAIDKVLLDRIHRIKFKNLSLEDKLIICKTHILPEIYKKMGLEDMILIEESILKVIIEEYTSEPGVRKLKEILFEIIGEINLDILNFNLDHTLPINISLNDIKEKYFKDKTTVNNKKIHQENKVGIINGLWANGLGLGGVIPIQSNYYPTQQEQFLNLKLTGLQGDVMKESMNVALTLAWNLTNKDKQEEILKNNVGGIHIHCPEGAVPKDGPSAGTAITVCLYSLLNNIKIKSNIALTGEISLDGNVTAIGGLDLKILGGIKANVTEFLYPKENYKEFDEFMEKYKDNEVLNGIVFHSVENIKEVLELVLSN